MQAIPIGIEEILAMAAVDDDFCTKLTSDRNAAIKASGVDLTPTEAGILAATDDKTLRSMIDSIEDRIPERDRRAFLKKSAAALLALVGGGLLTSAAYAEDPPMGGGGVRPGTRTGATSRGMRPDKPHSFGIGPDRPSSYR